jgi:hypothetical protein
MKQLRNNDMPKRQRQSSDNYATYSVPGDSSMLLPAVRAV